MGWTHYRRTDRVIDPVAELTTLFTHDGTLGSQTITGAARVGNTVYLAMHVTGHPTAKGPFTTALVVLIETAPSFGYKDMDESMGPYAADCPTEIMDLLSPVETLPYPGDAAAWRKRVADVRAARQVEG